jgi:hypothetical protein
VSWSPVAGADGYIVWIRHGASETAVWDRLAVVFAPGAKLVNAGMDPDARIAYKVQAFNAADWSADSPIATTAPSALPGLPSAAMPPAPPGDLVASAALGGGRVSLGWNDNSANESGFRVERARDAGFSEDLTTFVIAAGATGYTDVSVVPGTAYWYRAFAFNAAGSSDRSNVLGVVVPPTVPGAMMTRPAVALTWTEAADAVRGFIIERRLDPAGSFVAIGAADAGSRGFLDTSVEPETGYAYRVSAYNEAGTSPPSTATRIVTLGAIPEAPGSLEVAERTATSVRITWSPPPGGAAGCYVERSPEMVSWSRVATLAGGATSYTDTGLSASHTYWYRVQAYRGATPSAFTDAVSARTR